ncbi:MAG: sugar transferase, partial [Candidatus Kuenenia stuttgartiensis]|nr:sugar transferase [Candidatus Kuenenia stuttgartiensis]
MEQPFVIKLTLTQPSKATAQSDINEIREMFREINHRYMVYQPSPYYAAVKRVMDIFISMTFILLVMSWVFPIVALLIKLTSKGPVFFIQK